MKHSEEGETVPHIDPERCKGCGLCVAFCPFGRLALSEELNSLGHHPVEDAAGGATSDPETAARNFAFWCRRCRYCELICPDDAIDIPGEVAGLEGARPFQEVSETGDGHDGGGAA